MEFTRVISRKVASEARKAAKAHFDVNGLLSIDADPKTAKSNEAGAGYYTAILYLAPAKLSGFNTCASAVDCIAGCLHTAGNPIYLPAKEKARIGRTRLFFKMRVVFFILLILEIVAFVAKCKRLGLKPAIRLNGTSDIVWEKVAPWLFTMFPEVTFYDYTKHEKRVASGWALPPNYSLTFSRQLANDDKLAGIVAIGGNVAVVFRTKALPATFRGFPVINGDATDLRFLDPKGVIVGLSAKGLAKKDTSGFVVEA